VIDRVGQHFGNYQLVKLLGQGGSAQVYLGKHRYLNSYAALKVLNARLHLGNEHKFLAEAQTLADLRHPNIVHLLDFAIENGTPVLIMDYAPKGSLRQQTSHGTQMPLSTVVDFVAQIAASLQYAHNHHIIHRDVKPENILLDADDRLLLSDFGLSLLTPSSQELSIQGPAGTARYMAPEQLRGKPCFASDQYALAVMVYEWLCGELPFHGNMWEIWQQHLYTDPPPLRRIRPELPPQLEPVVQRALAKKPQDRFVSIQAFALALARASQTSPSIDDNDAPITASLKTVARSSPTAYARHAVALSSSNNQTVQIPTTAPTSVAPEPPRALTSQNQNRLRMLGRLRHSYSDLMSQSLQGTAWLDLGMASQPDAVQNAAHLLLHLPNRAQQHLPPGTSIMDVYDEAEHELLILGEPGAGKSTLLLDLAQQLLVRAEQDQTHPLPVILPLSSWAAKRLKLEDWIAEQLSQIYDVPRKLSLQWVQGDSILPLLDGLDEMEETARSACIVAINIYHREHLAKLAVCSRTTEYEAAASRHRLTLQEAVVVQPLTHKEVEAYLARAGQPLTALQSALKNNVALHDLATTPLMLNILILTYQGRSMHDLSTRQSPLLQQVWDDYIQRMTERRGNSKHYPLEQTRSRLGWLARQMRTHNQTVFYLEQMQPDWLDTRQRRIYEWLGVCLPATIIGALVSILIGWFFLGISGNLLQETILGALLGGLLNPMIPSNIARVAANTGHRWRTVLTISVGVGLVMGLSKAIDPSLNGDTTLNGRMLAGCIYFVMFSASSFLLQFLIPAFSRRTSPTSHASSGGWTMLQGFIQQRHLQHALLVALPIGLSYGLAIAPITQPSNRLIVGLGFGLTTGLKYGLASILISVILERLPKAIDLTDRVSFSWRNLRNRLFAASHLRFSLTLTGSIVTFIGLGAGLTVGLIVRPSVGLSHGLGYGLGYGLSYGLSAGLLYWLLLGLYQSIAQERIDDQNRRVPNQGIRQSLRNSLLLGLTSGTLIGGTGIMIFGLSYGLNTWLIHRLSNALNNLLSQKLSDAQNHGLGSFWSLFIASSILVWLISGGLAVWRHCVIRFLLRRAHGFPWNAPQFLDDATARILLRRVGGGYSFTHRLLLDHLADVETQVPPNSDEPSTQLLYP
jgi:serine/threonine protein kinase